MEWLKKMLGILSPIEKKKKQLDIILEKAFKAQRNGDLRTAGILQKEATELENEILEEISKR